MAAPTVFTDDAVSVATYSATLVGRCTWIDLGVATSYIGFQWGKTTAYGNLTHWTQAFPGETYYHDITGLEKGTTYHFRIIGAAGALRSYGADKSFTTTTVGPPPAPTPFMGWIIDKLTNVSGWFYSVYLAVVGWVWPFNLAADFFYEASWVFLRLAWNFYDFSVWVDDIATKIVTILSWDTIWDLILTAVPSLEEIRDWFYAWQFHVWQELTNWWRAKSVTVLGWIDEAKQWASLQIDSLEKLVYSILADVDELLAQIPDVSELIAWFSNWWGNVTSVIIAWGALTGTQIGSLIDSAIRGYEPFWAGWQDIRDKVFDFFADPVEFVWARFTNWFLGPEV